ncbi:PD-(D/E)XK nuclease family protein [Erythrobacter sp. HL-111]|uniref:PD-(D/E)XK nuclease family protein n=1 Tax=Erythrobacter sp. HL-111 TaxID=1798193 RepID=UPI0006DB2D5D|nr:PD-(D/E)XK nuclease family protein [Erythrobacter sp. HL-111]KPP90283.1 MAG: Inactivated superfamily I helicase [Erythrobacteraceae bacterium HL-111]SDR84939.1 ATP-dependent helicase/nuclease subunit B [Erythrobacter sp. HL-111]
MAKRPGPAIHSIAAHRGFADALVAGLVPRYREGDLGLARLTLIVPSTRAARTIADAFIRHAGEAGEAGLLMPRMVTVGDLDLDEALGALLDPLGAEDIPPAIDPGRRWLELAALVEAERAALGESPLPGAARLRLARDIARTMDRLLVEAKEPEDLLGEAVLSALGDLAEHWQRSLRLFARVQARWRVRLGEMGAVDAAQRRNLLFERAARQWRAQPPATPIIAAGVTSAAPALARMLRTIADLPNGAVILPDLDLAMSEAAWEELGRAGATPEPGGEVFARGDALTHPQYHLKLLLERMGVARAEVRPWHRRGMTAAEPERSRAISSLFLPPEASRAWIDLAPEQRRLSGVRMMTLATAEEEAQAIALLVREKLEVPGARIAVVTPDRGLARRVVQHLARWNIAADDSAGRPLALTPAGRLFGQLAELMSEGPTPLGVIAALAHPLVRAETPAQRKGWLASLRAFDHRLRGAAPAPGLGALGAFARRAGEAEWWREVEGLLEPLLQPLAGGGEDLPLADMVDTLAASAETLCGMRVWANEDGRALAAMIDRLRLDARACETRLHPRELGQVLRGCMDEVVVRPPYGGHPRVVVLGLLEARMTRADLVICAGLNEGTWPQSPSPDPLLAPGVLRALGVPGAEFRIGLAAHDLAGALGAPEVVLSRAQRDAEGPTLPSRFWLRAEALLGEKLAERQRETRIPALLPRLDRAPDPVPPAPRPEPRPSARQRDVAIRVTALDRLLGDPYQFYAQEILRLSRLDPLGADPFDDPALRGTLVHAILEAWHGERAVNPGLPLVPFAEARLARESVHPLFRGLWQPRILKALEWFESRIAANEAEGRTVLAWEARGAMKVSGVEVRGRADRIDRLPGGTLAIVDYKTGKPPTAAQVEAGFALQMGLLGLIARDGAFEMDGLRVSGEAGAFEYWSLGRDSKRAGEGIPAFGYVEEPVRTGSRRSGLSPEQFLPHHEAKLAEAIARYIRGDEPFRARENPDYPGYHEYDQLMRLDEWIVTLLPAGDTGRAGTKGDGR